MSSSDQSFGISELPESLISHILSLLPTKTAFATSFVSKTWKLHWTRVTALDFDSSLWPNSKEFQEFVNRVLISHSGESINKLRLRWKSLDSASCYPYVWAEAALARHVKVLDIDIRCSCNPLVSFALPGSLYRRKTLEILKLRGCFKVNLCTVNVHLPKLTVLLMKEVIYESDECVRKLISAAPLLQSLSIRLPSGYTVSSPLLKRLQMIDCEYGVKEINAPGLEYLSVANEKWFSGKVSIRGETSVEVNLRCTACKDGFPVCSKFPMFYKIAMSIIGKATKFRLAERLGNLTKLVVRFNHVVWSSLVDMLDRCINLQVLEISYSSPSGRAWEDPVRVPRCVSSSLKEVTFATFCGTQDEKSVMDWILQHGKALKDIQLCKNPREGGKGGESQP